MQDLEVEDTLCFKAPAPSMSSSLAYLKQLWFQAPAPRMLSSLAYSSSFGSKLQLQVWLRPADSSKLWFRAPAPSVSLSSCTLWAQLYVVPSSSSSMTSYAYFSIVSTYFKHCVQRLLPNAINSLQPSSPSTSNSLSSNSYGFAVFVVGFTKPSRGERDPTNSISTGHG